MKRVNISSGAPWESVVGYSRAVKVGSYVFVAGTTATGPDGKIEGLSDAYRQTQVALLKIEAALKEAGASLTDVVRTRLFVTDITQWAAIARTQRGISRHTTGFDHGAGGRADRFLDVGRDRSRRCDRCWGRLSFQASRPTRCRTETVGSCRALTRKSRFATRR